MKKAKGKGKKSAEPVSKKEKRSRIDVLLRLKHGGAGTGSLDTKRACRAPRAYEVPVVRRPARLFMGRVRQRVPPARATIPPTGDLVLQK